MVWPGRRRRQKYAAFVGAETTNTRRYWANAGSLLQGPVDCSLRREAFRYFVGGSVRQMKPRYIFMNYSHESAGSDQASSHWR
jgi:hypothetical protein